MHGVLHLHIKFLYGKAWNNINESGIAGQYRSERR